MQKENQKEVFEEIIKNNKGILFKVARIYCQTECERPDLIQEIMIQLWLSFPKYNNRYKITTWIYRISLNVAITFFRKKSTQINSKIQLDEFLSKPVEVDHQEKELNLNLLERFINELREFDKALMFLYLEEKNYKEISDILGISESNISTRINRIKNKLKEKFATIKN